VDLNVRTPLGRHVTQPIGHLSDVAARHRKVVDTRGRDHRAPLPPDGEAGALDRL